MKTGIKKKIVLLTACSALTLGVTAFVATSSYRENDAFPTVGIDENYSLTINAEDVTKSASPTYGSYVAHTDQLNNPVTFNYENVSYEEDGDNKYLVFGTDAWFGNDKYSQVKKIKTVTIYGNGGVFTYNYGWELKLGSIQYTTVDRYSNANGQGISLSDKEPNFFILMHRDGQADVKVSKIVFTYSKDCTSGVKPATVLSSITLDSYTTAINRGSAFSFGGNVIAHYSDDTTANVTTKTTFSGYNMNTAGTYTVTASYTEGGVTKTATYKLTVNKIWVAIWTGSVTHSNAGGNTRVCTLNLSGTVTLRVTWSCSASGGTNATTTYYNNNGSTTTTTKPSNPFQFNLNAGSNRTNIVGVARYTSGDSPAGRGIRLFWYANGYFTLQGGEGVGGTGNISVSMTVTKIERYY